MEMTTSRTMPLRAFCRARFVWINMVASPSFRCLVVSGWWLAPNLNTTHHSPPLTTNYSPLTTSAHGVCGLHILHHGHLPRLLAGGVPDADDDLQPAYRRRLGIAGRIGVQRLERQGVVVRGGRPIIALEHGALRT